MTATPIALLSLLMLEVPLVPTFGAESTAEGIVTLAMVAAWFYATPVVLLVIARRRRGRPVSLARRFKAGRASSPAGD